MNDSNAAVKKHRLGKKAKIALGIVCMLAVIAICALAIAAYAKNNISEGTVELEPEPEAALSEIPSSEDGALSLLSSLINKSKDSSMTYTDVSTELFIDDESIIVDGDASHEANILKHIKSTVLNSVKGFYPSHEGTFGDGFNSLPKLALNSLDVGDVICETGVRDENGDITEENYYYFYITMPEFKYQSGTENAVYSAFGLPQAQAVADKVLSETADILSVADRDIICSGFSIEARADKRTNRLDFIKVIREYEITAIVDFLGEFKSIGTKEISFTLKAEENYQFTWAGADFTEHKLILPVGDDEPLPLEAVIADDATSEDYTISFESSDESVLTVDKDGNIKGLKESKKPVTVTVKFDYLGNTYTDSIDVYVVIPVERIAVSPREMNLSVGGSQTLNYETVPVNATIQSVRWFSEDEKIAVIDSSGTVTAKGNGQTKVYAVSEDGFFKSSCTVTVTE